MFNSSSTSPSLTQPSDDVVHPDLQRERSQATFHVERLTHLMDGGNAQRTARRRQLEAMIAKDPTGIFSNDDNIYLHRSDRHVRALAKHVRLIELCRKLNIGHDDDSNGEIIASPDFYTLLGALADDLPTSLHWVMFVPNIMSLCDAEQQQEWLPLCRDWRMIGCYAQTELGHGSNVRALETTATFRSERDDDGMPGGSFVIHSPTLTSAKFWPGTLGRTANHAMVIARLIDGEGIDRGVHNFLVPLRSMTTHELLPGVVTGDIGPKIGYNVMDNGYAQFNNVVIPRCNMAMRFARVNEQGQYTTTTSASDSAISKIAYITMMQVRAYIVNEASKNLAMACTIAIRYSAVRRQGYDNNNNNNNDESGNSSSSHDATELQILDYKQQQHRLFPRLAASYCFFFTGRRVLQQLKDLEQQLIQSSTERNGASGNHHHHRTAVTKTQVADIHASTSALKSFVTMITADGMEDCRKACGGHGFLQCSGLPELVTTYLQNPTVEGDNYMLPQQVVKVLLKLVEAVMVSDGDDVVSDYASCDAGRLIPSLQAMIHNEEPEHCTAISRDDLLNNNNSNETLLLAYRHRAARLLLQVAQRLQEATSSGQKSVSEAWNEGLIQMFRVSKAYALYLLLANMNEGIQQEQEQHDSHGATTTTIGKDEVKVLQDLMRLFALYWMERDMGDFLEDGYMTAVQASWVRDAVLDMLQVVRPNAIALVDARDFSDFRLKSALGRWDGQVYPAIMKAAQKDPLNTNNVGPGYQEHLKRLIVDGVGVYHHHHQHKHQYTASRL